MTTLSASFRRLLSHVVIGVSSVLAGTAALWACGPYFPRWLLGPERLLEAQRVRWFPEVPECDQK